MRPLADTVNHYAPALTLLAVVGGFVWAIATWNAEFRAVSDDLDELKANLRTVQDDVRSVRETLPHVVSCMIDLERSRLAAAAVGQDTWLGDPGTALELIMPASCEQARRRTNP